MNNKVFGICNSEGLKNMLYTEILNKNKDFLFLYRKGKTIGCKYVVVYVRPNNRPYNRLGITAGKKVGNAVHRNRAKRIIRQAYSENEKELPLGIDIVIVARAAICDIKSDVLSSWLAGYGIKGIKNAVFGGKEK